MLVTAAAKAVMAAEVEGIALGWRLKALLVVSPAWVRGVRHHHSEWQPGQAEIAAAGGADRRSAKNADRPMNQSREAHHSAWPLHSPEGGQSAAVFAADWPHEGA